MKWMGLFSKKSKGVGLKANSGSALAPNSSAEARLGCRAHLDFELDMVMNQIHAIAEDIHSIAGLAKHQRFTEQIDEHEHFRCISEVRFWYVRTWPNAAFYIELPESKRLLPIVKALRDRRCNGNSVVWVSDYTSEPMVVSEACIMYVSDEPDVSGKTIEEMRLRYVSNINH